VAAYLEQLDAAERLSGSTGVVTPVVVMKPIPIRVRPLVQTNLFDAAAKLPTALQTLLDLRRTHFSRG
jgi:hypothetical protein